MKNISQLIYITISLILLVSCIFTIADLNIISKQNYSNHLEQSVIMTASFFMICKLIIQSVMTYISFNILYLKIKDNHMEKDLNRSMDKISNWANQPEKMKTVKEQQEAIMDKFIRRSYVPVDESISETDVSLLQFDPIDEIDKIDGIVRDRKGFIKDITVESNIDVVKDDEPVGVPLRSLLKNTDKSSSFNLTQILDNKNWRQLNINEYGNYHENEMEYIDVDGERYWYVLME